MSTADRVDWRERETRCEHEFSSAWVSEHPTLALEKTVAFILKYQARGFKITFDKSIPYRPTIVASKESA